MAADFDRLLNEALREGWTTPMLGSPFGGTDDTTALPPTLTVKRHSAYISMSTEQALDAGLITEEQARAQGWTPYVPLPVPWHRRARWRWAAWRERPRRKVGGWIAGVDLSERDEDW